MNINLVKIIEKLFTVDFDNNEVKAKDNAEVGSTNTYQFELSNCTFTLEIEVTGN